MVALDRHPKSSGKAITVSQNDLVKAIGIFKDSFSDCDFIACKEPVSTISMDIRREIMEEKNKRRQRKRGYDDAVPSKSSSSSKKNSGEKGGESKSDKKQKKSKSSGGKEKKKEYPMPKKVVKGSKVSKKKDAKKSK